MVPGSRFPVCVVVAVTVAEALATFVATLRTQAEFGQSQGRSAVNCCPPMLRGAGGVLSTRPVLVLVPVEVLADELVLVPVLEAVKVDEPNCGLLGAL